MCCFKKWLGVEIPTHISKGTVKEEETHQLYLDHHNGRQWILHLYHHKISGVIPFMYN